MEHARRTRLTKIGRARYLEVVAHVVAEVSRDNGRRGLWGQRRNGPVLAGVLAAKAVGARGNGGVMVAKGSFLELFLEAISYRTRRDGSRCRGRRSTCGLKKDPRSPINRQELNERTQQGMFHRVLTKAVKGSPTGSDRQ